jgi:hypothetical protein
LVEVSVELAPLDPLLQAVWLVTLGETGVDIPDDLRFLLRAVVPEVNGAFKGADAGAKNVLGMSFSQAYAEGLLAYLTGAWDADTPKTRWWSVLVEALKLPPAWHEYRSGWVRLLELYSLAMEPGTTLPLSGDFASIAGGDATDRTDLREVATLSLGLDAWTSEHGQLGRSVAYDCAFVVEPWRRGESVGRALELLEAHRHAALKFWLTVVPPLIAESPKGRRRDHAIEDRDLAREYRALAYLGTLEEAPLYARTYLDGTAQRMIRVDESDRIMRLMALDKRRHAWHARATKDWPEYAAARAQGRATLKEVAAMLGIG